MIYLSTRAGSVKGNQVTVMLFPVTPYLLEYLKLKKQENRDKLKIVYMDPNAWNTRIEATTTANGDFIFTKMKPGEYYLKALYHGILRDITTSTRVLNKIQIITNAITIIMTMLML